VCVCINISLGLDTGYSANLANDGERRKETGKAQGKIQRQHQHQKARTSEAELALVVAEALWVVPASAATAVGAVLAVAAAVHIRVEGSLQEADVAHRSAAVAEAGDRVVVVEVAVVVKAGARWVLRVLRRVRRRGRVGW
jgi:hypothetical protein